MNSLNSKNLPPQAEPTSHCLQLPVKGDAKILPRVPKLHIQHGPLLERVRSIGRSPLRTSSRRWRRIFRKTWRKRSPFFFRGNTPGRFECLHKNTTRFPDQLVKVNMEFRQRSSSQVVSQRSRT